jgi:hypothetical protein
VLVFHPDGKLLAASSFGDNIQVGTCDGALVTCLYGESDSLGHLERYFSGSGSDSGGVHGGEVRIRMVFLVMGDGSLVKQFICGDPFELLVLPTKN